MTLDIAREQTTAVRAVLAMVSRFADLPAAYINLQNFTPWGVKLAVSDDLSAFEQWREALGFAPASVEQHTSRGGTLGWLQVAGTWNGAQVELTGFYDLPDSEPGAQE